MNNREQFQELVKAQDLIRRVYAHQDKGVLNTWLKEIDKDLTKAINALGGMLEDHKAN